MRVAGIYPQPVELDLGLDPDPDEPLGIGYVLSRAAKDGHEVALFIPVDGDWSKMHRRIAAFRPDVVAVSALTKHVDIARRLASEIRSEFDKCLFVAGGSHVTAAPFDLLDDYDVCVLGEGDECFAELLTAFGQGGALDNVSGISFRAADGSPAKTHARARIRNLDDLPWPIREPLLHYSEAQGICYPLPKDAGFASILYSRGCPYTCSFCSSPQHWGRGVSFRSPDDVVAEIAHVRDQFGVRFVSFADLTFTINRRRTIELCERLIAARLGVHWMCETSINNADPELLEIMAAAGCTKICWGVETTDDVSIASVGKRQSLEQAYNVLAWAADLGVFNWAFTMLGFPWHSEDEILGASARLPALPIHQLRVSIATPFPGTAWSAQFPALLETRSSFFDTNHLVFEHATISQRRMKELQRLTLSTFYRSLEYGARMDEMAIRFPHLSQSIAVFRSRVAEWLCQIDSAPQCESTTERTSIKPVTRSGSITGSRAKVVATLEN